MYIALVLCISLECQYEIHLVFSERHKRINSVIIISYHYYVIGSEKTCHVVR